MATSFVEFDIVVPAGMNDYQILTKSIEYAKQNNILK